MFSAFGASDPLTALRRWMGTHAAPVTPSSSLLWSTSEIVQQSEGFGLMGLQNDGNTCFRNVIIQVRLRRDISL